MKQLACKKSYSLKIFFIIFMLSLCPLLAHAAPIDDPFDVSKEVTEYGSGGLERYQMGLNNLEAYRQLEGMSNQIGMTLQGIDANTNTGKSVDWDAIKSAYGMNPDLSPDEVYNTLLKNRNDLLKLIGDVESKSIESGRTVAEYLKNFDNVVPYHFIIQNLQSNLTDMTTMSPANPKPILSDEPTASEPAPVFYDVTAMLSALQAQIPQLIRFIKALSWLMGIFFVMAGVMKLKAYGQQTMMSSTHASMTGPLVYITIGSLLIYFPSIFFVVTETLMGGGDSVLSYTPGELSGFGFASLLAVVVAIVRLVGFIAFLKGWVILTKLGSQSGQPGTVGKAIVHIVGGVLAVNIITTWEILRATFGYVW